MLLHSDRGNFGGLVRGRSYLVLVTFLLLSMPSFALTQEPPKQKPSQQEPSKQQPLTEAAARERAQLLHKVYTATLDVMHERYFHGERAMVPARALEDVFSEMSRQANIEARWISVNTRAMSLNHEPKSAFEKKAAAELAAGKGEYEIVEDGLYRRAAPILLHESCVSCHTASFAQVPKTPRFAGLVISVAVDQRK